MKEIWSLYDVRFNFLTDLCASVPANKEIVTKWLEAKEPKVKPAGGRSIAEIQEEVVATLAEGEETLEEQMEKSMLVFQRVDGVLVLGASTFRAHWKECAGKLSSLYIGKIQGERTFKQRVLNGVYHDETRYWIPILNQDGNLITDPAYEIKHKAVIARGPRGTVNALKVFEVIDRPIVDLRLKVLGNCVRQEDLETLFQYGGTHGYGGESSDGEGRYIATVEMVSKSSKVSKEAKVEANAELVAK
jgi:hypothetical protein